MTHLSDDELVMRFYREGDGFREAEAHMASCAGCCERFERLTMALREVESELVPERDESYGAEVWARLRPRLEAEQILCTIDPHPSHRSEARCLIPGYHSGLC